MLLRLLEQICRSKWAAIIVFLGLGALYLWKAGYGEITFERPGSVHQWRQTDGASLAKIYFQEGNSIFEPAIHNQLNGEGKAGGEFPILYYISGKLYHLLGPKESIIRILHLSIFLIGYLALFLAFLQVCPVPILTPVPFLVLWSSPTLAYYTNNFLPDGPGLGFALLGLALIWYGNIRHERLYYYLGAVAVMFATLVKISVSIPFIAMFGVVIIRQALAPDQIRLVPEMMRVKDLVFCTLIILVPVLAWYGYIRWYNDVNEGIYFATSARPIWSMTMAEIKQTIDTIVQWWFHILWPRSSWILVAMAFLLFLGRMRKNWRSTAWVFLAITLLGMACYALLFFQLLRDHDYYFLTMMMGALLVMIYIVQIFSDWLKENHSSRIPAAALVSLALAGFTLNAGANKMNDTYLPWFEEKSLNTDLNDLEPWLEDHGISYNDYLISLPDFSSNASLYLMNRKGWTGLTGMYNTDDADKVIERGAEYVVVLDTSFYSITFLQDHITDTIGYHGSIGVYRIEKSR